MIEVETRIVYWNEDLLELWGPRIRRISSAYNKTELATMLLGMRRVYVYHINSERFEESYEFLRENDLSFFLTDKSGVYQGFSHKHMPVEKGKPYNLFGAAVKRNDHEAGKLFKEYSSANPTNHVGIGKVLLGYPDCCTEAFDEIWPNISIDPIFETALETKGMKRNGNTVTVSVHPYSNNMLRYFGIRIIPHITCSMQCSKTIEQGKRWWEIMSEIDNEAAKWAKEILSMPMTWNCYRGVAIIDTPVFRGITNSDMTLKKKIVNSLGWKQ